MDKKNLMIIGGVIAIAAIAYFVFKKKKDDKNKIEIKL